MDTDKKITHILINTRDIIVDAITNETDNHEKLDSNPKEQEEKKEIEEIFEKYNIESAVIYHYDNKIVRALAGNRDQLVDYLEVCRKASYPAKRVEVPDTIPDIEYDLRGLKDSFPEIEDEALRKKEQIQLYNNAKEVCSMLREKTTLKVGLSDKIYIMVAKFRQPKNEQDTILLLGAGSTRNTNAEEKLGDNENIQNKEVIENDNNKKAEFKESLKVELPANERPVNEETIVEVPEKTSEIEPSKDDVEELAI